MSEQTIVAKATPGKLEDYQAWRDQNPLRRWRLGRTPRVSMREIAGMVGVNLYSVDAWEHGNNKPTPENMSKLSVAMDSPDLASHWETWLSQRPS